jgi:exodeoxyribonuclease-3
VNCYFPNANGELSRLPYKEEFNGRFLDYVNKLKKHKPVIACGDFNVAHEPIDLARPKANEGEPGYTAEERAWMGKFLSSGLVDTFRMVHGDRVQYSWWSYRAMARQRNVGWRIDYFLASGLLDQVADAFIWDDVAGSDHCPVGVVIKNC